MIPHKCHSRFCNACGITYAKQLAAKASSFYLAVTHQHLVFTIPESLRNIFREDRSRLESSIVVTIRTENVDKFFIFGFTNTDTHKHHLKISQHEYTEFTIYKNNKFHKKNIKKAFCYWLK